jgi:hypothetical protein
MDFSNYTFRSHMTGKIISVPKPLTGKQIETLASYRKKDKPLTEKQREDLISLEFKHNESKVYKLTDGAKKVLTEIVFYEKHGRRKILENLYLEKGLIVEKSSRDLLSEVLNVPLIADDEQRQNEWVRGKRDINTKDKIIEIKSKFDYTTFCDSLLESSNEIYLRQLDCYMDLWNVSESSLCHVLIDTPAHIVNSLIRKLDYKENILDMTGNVRDECIETVVNLVQNSIYTREGLETLCDFSENLQIEWFHDFVEIPKAERIHMIPHQLDKIRLEQRNECIKLSREYMNTVKPINNIIQLN